MYCIVLYIYFWPSNDPGYNFYDNFKLQKLAYILPVFSFHFTVFFSVGFSVISEYPTVVVVVAAAAVLNRRW